MGKYLDLLDAHIKRYNKNIEISRKIITELENENLVEVLEKVSLYLNDSIFIIIPNLDHLHSIRRILKRIYPDYTDRVGYIGGTRDGMGYAYYYPSGELKHVLRLCLIMPIDKFPKIKKGCGFKIVQNNEPTIIWEYVCENDGVKSEV